MGPLLVPVGAGFERTVFFGFEEVVSVSIGFVDIAESLIGLMEQQFKVK